MKNKLLIFLGALALVASIGSFTSARVDNPMAVPVTTSAYSAGTIYSLTATPAAIDFGTTDPSITITSPGTYLIFSRVRTDYNAATFLAVRTATYKLRRTNNTAADLTNSTTALKTSIITALTSTAETIDLPAVIYTTTNSDDVVTIFGDISVLPTAGSIDVSEASLVAFKLY